VGRSAGRQALSETPCLSSARRSGLAKRSFCRDDVFYLSASAGHAHVYEVIVAGNEVWAWTIARHRSRARRLHGQGGDSLRAMQAIIGLRAAGIPADVTHLYEAQTLGEFTELITAKMRQSR